MLRPYAPDPIFMLRCAFQYMEADTRDVSLLIASFIGLLPVSRQCFFSELELLDHLSARHAYGLHDALALRCHGLKGRDTV